MAYTRQLLCSMFQFPMQICELIEEVIIKREFTGGMQKLFKLKEGVVFACCGNRGLSNKVLFEFGIPHDANEGDNFSKGDVGLVLVTNPYTGTITTYIVTAKSENKK